MSSRRIESRNETGEQPDLTKAKFVGTVTVPNDTVNLKQIMESFLSRNKGKITCADIFDPKQYRPLNKPKPGTVFEVYEYSHDNVPYARGEKFTSEIGGFSFLGFYGISLVYDQLLNNLKRGKKYTTPEVYKNAPTSTIYGSKMDPTLELVSPVKSYDTPYLGCTGCNKKLSKSFTLLMFVERV